MALALTETLERPRVRFVGLAIAVVAAGLATGWLAATAGAPKTVVLLLAVPIAVLSMRSIWVPFAAVVAVIAFVPFFVLPISAGGASPTLFEVAVFAALMCYLAILVVDRRERVEISAPIALWFLLSSYLVVAFVMGARAGAGPDLLRLFGKFGLALAMFWITVQLVRDRRDVQRLVGLLVVGSATSAGIALLLYAGGPSLTFRLLSRLVPYGYPSERIVRFIEDNPASPMRAIGTGVDPNAFGGLVMIGMVLATGLALSRNRFVPQWLAWVAVGLTGAAVLLTYSRGAWMGAAAGVAIIVCFRVRILVPIGFTGVLAGLVAGLGGGFVARISAAVRLEDQATRERLEEYANAVAIIREHLWFGIGFGSAPSPEFGVGVSSIFLLIAEQAGMIGLFTVMMFLVVLGYRTWRAFRATDDDLMLTCGAAFAAVLTVGLVDHYFFNIRFAHMAALFWILAGLLAVMSSDRFVSGIREGSAR